MNLTVPPAYITLANQLADMARPIANRYFRQPIDILDKQDESPVTIADQEIEATIREYIHATAPEHGIYGEEYGHQDIDAEWVWVIDPIDGTRAFITGVPLFGILIALCHRGEPIYGVIDQPFLQERWQGGHSHPTTYNGKAVRTRSCPHLAEAYQFTTAPDMFIQPADLAAFQRLSQQVKLVRFGVDCYAAGLIANGHADLMVEADLKPFDFMALIPVVEAAGGCVTSWSGDRLTFDSDGRMVISSDRALHAQVLTILQG